MSQSYQKTLFLAASSLDDPKDLETLLDGACKDDPELRKQIESLLDLQDAATDYFESKPVASEPDQKPGDDGDERLGTSIGRYRIIDRVGAGGYGVVYLAEQTEPVRRKVALKVVRPGIGTEQIISRFERERQTLAMMDHPNIARVLDAGSTSSNRPFFVMQLVDGSPITEFCDKRQMPVLERLQLFRSVCLAIQHAHQKGIIHCDIKPSNILITLHDGIPTPKVIDFGIAKAMEGDYHETDSDAPLLSIGTPPFMSPEQVRGGSVDVDSTTDIYSLGVVLYELLCGLPPRDPKLFEPFDRERIQRMLYDNALELPSERLESSDPKILGEAAKNRHTEPSKLIKTLRGDLDAIVAKAMQAEPQQRYETVNRLSMEIHRYLTHEPVQASGNGRCYLLSKLVRRNKGIFAAGSIVLLALIAGFGTSTWLFLREADARKQQAQLRIAAEQARAVEAALRKKAEAGEVVAHAAVLIRDDKIEEANELLDEIPLKNVPASLESAETFRTVGEWLLPQEKKQEAARRFAAVAQAIATVDKSMSDSISIHFVAAAAALVDAGDFEHYEDLRGMAAERFSDADHPIILDEVVKACLVIPCDTEQLAKFDPMLEQMTHHLPWDREDTEAELMEAWQMLSLTLGAYRNEDYQLAERWARRGLNHPNVIRSRSASLQAVLAMALHQVGRVDEAKVQFDSAATTVNEHFEKPFEEWSLEGGFWFDWVIARILLQEAAGLLGSS